MRYAYYPGCSLHSTSKEFDISARAVCQALGIELEEIPGWICCGASSAHATNELLSIALPVKNLVLAPLRSLIWNCIDTREDFEDLTIVYGARSIADLTYKPELQEWVEMDGVTTVLTVDPGGEDESWEGEVGFVPTILEKVNPSPENATVITCGPPIMIKFVLLSLGKLEFAPAQVVTTLEMKMKCGLGKCGRCNIGNKYVCKDGPVFTAEQLQALPNEY